MPQIWMTYAELANLFALEEAEASSLVAERGLNHVIDAHGQPLVQLCSTGLAKFIERVRAPNPVMDAALKEISGPRCDFDRPRAFVGRMTSRPYHPWIN